MFFVLTPAAVALEAPRSSRSVSVHRPGSRGDRREARAFLRTPPCNGLGRCCQASATAVNSHDA
jgi:hypothetical protein